MGNLPEKCHGENENFLELDRPESIYLPKDFVSGTVSNLKQSYASILLVGCIHFKKRKRNGLEKCRIIFFSSEFNLFSTRSTKQDFKLQLDEQLPPSINDKHIYPNISYSVNLIFKKAKNHIYSTIPIRVCPHVKIDRPLLLSPIFFGPLENHLSGIKIQVKTDRAVFKYDDDISIFYEIQNPKQEYIDKIQINLGVFYLIESNVYHKDLCHGSVGLKLVSSTNKLIRNKIVLSIPNNNLLPPTYKFRYGRENDKSSFSLSIDYKIQFKIIIGRTKSLWQIDIPIILCHETNESNPIQ